jgi:transmembrane sensor
MEYKDLRGIELLILGFLDGSASPEEIEKLEDWISLSEENRRYFEEMKNTWEVSANLNVSTEKALSAILDKINRKTGWQSSLLWFQRIAAVLVVPLLLSLFLINARHRTGEISGNITYNNTSAAFGTFSYLELPDGSRVWLNSGSKLRYPDRFPSGDRLVYLSGEAYFEVHSDPSSPFIVNTPYFSVTATGTRFNVLAYEKTAHPAVTLIEGKVDVKKAEGDRLRKLSVLSPGEHMVFDTLNETVSVDQEEPYKHIAWKDGKLVFRNDPITEVARRISQQYNVDIQIEGEKIMSYRFRARFESEPLDELLRLLKLSSPIDYREIKPEVLPDGSFSKRKIIIFSTESQTKE